MGNRILHLTSRRALLWSVLLGTMLLVLSGCAPRFAAEDIAIPQEGDLAVSLPTIVLDVDEQGQLSLGGVPVKELGAAFGQDLSAAELPSMLVGLLSQANVQHLQLTNTGSSLTILANGMQLPSISWQEGTLDSSAEVLTNLGVIDADMAALLPLLEQAGVGVLLNLPVEEGAERLPLVDTSPSEAVQSAQESQSRFLGAVRDRIPELSLTINYNERGEASIQGIPTFLLATLGVSLDALNQDPAVIQQMKDANIETITMRTNAEGAGIGINGEALPYIDWSDGKMISFLMLLEDAGVLDNVSDQPRVRDAIVGLLQEILPIVQAADLTLTVNFN
jgi:hypothetical protein